MLMISDLQSWLATVFSHWQYWLSGGGFGGAVALVVLGWERLRGEDMRNRTYVLIFVVGFFVGSSFMAWRDEHHQVEADKGVLAQKQAELDDLKKPNLEGEVIQAGSFDLIVPPNGHLTNYSSSARIPTALLWAKIKNHGADSIAENYQLTITLNNGRQLQTTMLAIPKNIKPKNWRERSILESSASLVEKTVEKPIIRGGQEVGLLMFVINPADYLREELAKKGVVYTLSFTDSSGKEYHAQKSLVGGGGREPGYVPGAGVNP